MAFFNKNKGKQSALLDAFSQCDKRRKYYLYLASCYFNCDAAIALSKELKKQHFKIIGTEIWLDRSEALSIGKERLQKLEGENQLTVYITKNTTLFHTKGYCLACYDENDNIVSGCLALGSPNLTKAGIGAVSGNIESLLTTTNINDIQAFLESSDELKWITTDDLDTYTKEDINFILALLKEGQFCHKWSDSLNQYLAVRYDLSEEGKKRSQGDPLFQETGFEMAAATISKQYFEFDINHPLDSNLIKNYGIETFLGHWLPRAALPDQDDDNAFQRFKDELFTALDDQILVICNEINCDYLSLKNGHFIKSEDSPAERFKDKVNELKENDDKLYRIWCQREFFDLPYDISNRERIRYTFLSLIETLKKQKKWNKSMHAVNEAREQLSLNPLYELQPEP